MCWKELYEKGGMTKERLLEFLEKKNVDYEAIDMYYMTEAVQDIYDKYIEYDEEWIKQCQ